jgi:hypothetical protein
VQFEKLDQISRRFTTALQTVSFFASSIDSVPGKLAEMGLPVATIGRPIESDSTVSTVASEENQVIEEALPHPF